MEEEIMKRDVTSLGWSARLSGDDDELLRCDHQLKINSFNSNLFLVYTGFGSLRTHMFEITFCVQPLTSVHEDDSRPGSLSSVTIVFAALNSSTHSYTIR